LTIRGSARQLFTPTILAGAGEAVESADVTVTTVDPYDANLVLKSYTFNLAAAYGTWMDKLALTASSATDVPHIDSVFTYAL
jgi:hypothetical protein